MNEKKEILLNIVREEKKSFILLLPISYLLLVKKKHSLSPISYIMEDLKDLNNHNLREKMRITITQARFQERDRFFR